MAESVSHKGKVVRMTPQVTTVVILQHAACGECHAAGLCGMADLAEKTVELPTDPYAAYGVGDEVEVVLKKAMGYKAVFIAYGLPLVVLFVTLMLLNSLGVGELYAGLGAIGAVALCYLVIFLFRNKLSKEYTFYLK